MDLHVISTLQSHSTQVPHHGNPPLNQYRLKKYLSTSIASVFPQRSRMKMEEKINSKISLPASQTKNGDLAILCYRFLGWLSDPFKGYINDLQRGDKVCSRIESPGCFFLDDPPPTDLHHGFFWIFLFDDHKHP